MNKNYDLPSKIDFFYLIRHVSERAKKQPIPPPNNEELGWYVTMSPELETER